MFTDSPYVAKRVAPDVPIWDILVRGVYVGCMTNLPMEINVMATIRYNGEVPTFEGATIWDVLGQLGSWLEEQDHILNEEAEIAAAEYYAEVIAPMEYAERLSEAFHEWDLPPEAY